MFNPYTGEDLGDAFSRGEQAVLWTVRLHDDLLYGTSGRYWNGVASAFVTLLCLTGAVVWWPGISRWRRSLIVRANSGWRRFNWDLHSAMGAWLFLFILMWGVSGFYMGVPGPFTAFVEYVSSPDPEAMGDRPGDIALAWLSRLHFGLGKRLAQGVLGGRGSGARNDVRDRHDHVVESRRPQASRAKRRTGNRYLRFQISDWRALT
jgi:hypothetical protein